MKRYLVYTTDDLRMRSIDPTRFYTPAPHQNRRFADPVEKVGLAAQDSVGPEDIVGETLIGVPAWNAPVVRAVTDRYAAQTGIDLTPDHEALNLSMAFSLVASTGGVALMPLYARNLMPKSVVSRPIRGAPPMIDLVLGYNEANTSPQLKFLLSKVEDLKFRVSGPQSN
jgi:LysR family transcriptional regulator, hca operon transcriptional activator